MPEPLAAIYEQHVASVWRYACARVPDHADAEDVTSEVFARAARAWDRYDPERGSVAAWLTGIAHHVVADWWRGRGPELLVDDVVAVGAGAGVAAADPGWSPERVAEVRADTAEVRRHLGLLTEREREALALRFAAGLSSAEVGEVLGVSDAGARMLVYRAVGKLRAVMADE